VNETPDQYDYCAKGQDKIGLNHKLIFISLQEFLCKQFNKKCNNIFSKNTTKNVFYLENQIVILTTFLDYFQGFKVQGLN
jgi:hypothetical protein